MLDNVVLFDGVCSLCNSSIDFVVRNEHKDTLKFASLQSDIGKNIVAQSGLDEVPDSILFYSNGVLYMESTAVLLMCKHLRPPYRWFSVLRVIPRFFRDSVYGLIARNRYRWFGKRNTCRVPTAAEKNKFLG